MNNMVFRYNLFMFLSNLRFTRAIWLTYLVSRGLSITEVGILESVYHFSRFVFDVPAGMIADLWSRSKTVAIGTACAGIAALMIAFNQSLVWLVLAFFVDGLSLAFQRGNDKAILYAFLTQKGREEDYTKMCGIANSSSYSSLALATFLGGLLFDRSMTAPFLIYAAFCALGAWLIYNFPGENRSYSEPGSGNLILVKAGFRALIKLKGDPAFAIWAAVFFFGVVNIVSVYAQGYFSSLGFKNANIGLIFSVTTMISVVAGLFAGHLKRFCANRLLAVFWCILLSALLMMLSGVSFPAVAGFLILYTSVDFIEPIVSGKLNRIIPEDSRATVLSAYNSIISLFIMLMFPVLGKLIDVGGYKVFLIAVLCLNVILLAGCILLLRRKGNGLKKSCASDAG